MAPKKRVAGRRQRLRSDNLRAAGGSEVQVGGDRWWVAAREVDGAERDECWRLAVAAYPDFAGYQELTDRRIPVAVLERAPRPESAA